MTLNPMPLESKTGRAASLLNRKKRKLGLPEAMIFRRRPPTNVASVRHAIITAAVYLTIVDCHCVNAALEV